MEKLTLRAMAKVNLGLDVVRRLENGYHEVKMIMQSVDLYDELTFEKTEIRAIIKSRSKKVKVKQEGSDL